MAAIFNPEIPSKAQPLRDLLAACSAGSQDDVSRAIVTICQGDTDARQQVVDLGGLLPLTDLLTSSDLPAPH